MNQAGLQLEQAPPISVPFRFFLAAPVFLLLTSAVLLWRGPAVFEARLSSSIIALTHLYALGFMAMVMIGSMMQMLPVLQGSPVPLPRTTAGLTFAGVGLGTLALAAGFLFGERWLLRAGVIALSAGFLVFVAAVLVCLARAPNQNQTVRAMWLAVLSLLVTVVLGAMLASLFGWGVVPANTAVHGLHPGWSLLGWTGLLVIGVGYELVPMLQMTPLYPRPMARYLSAAIFVLLLIWSAALWAADGRWGPLATGGAAAMAAAYALFAVVTLALQRRRRRRLPDVTLDFWRVGMGSLIGASLIWGARLAWTGAGGAWADSADILIGVLAMFGFAGFVISGMLYKIMPFLAWFHLQSTCPPGKLAPNMKKILPDADQRLQLRSQALALALLCAAALWPAPFVVYPAALALAATAVLLGRNMVVIVLAYRDILAQQRLAEVPA